MKLDIIQDIRPITDFRNQTAKIIKQLNKTKNPILLTQRGKSAAVLVDAEVYQNQLDKIELLSSILRGKEDIKAGKIYSHMDIMKDLDEWVK